MESYFQIVVFTKVKYCLSGGHIVGKTNCENLCFSASSNTCWAGPVLNPKDKTRSAGGSSSGSGVVVSVEHSGESHCNTLCIPLPIRKFLAPPNKKSMGQSGSLMTFCIQTMK